MLRVFCLLSLHLRRVEDPDSPELVCRSCGHRKPLWRNGPGARLFVGLRKLAKGRRKTY